MLQDLQGFLFLRLHLEVLNSQRDNTRSRCRLNKLLDPAVAAAMERVAGVTRRGTRLIRKPDERGPVVAP